MYARRRPQFPWKQTKFSQIHACWLLVRHSSTWSDMKTESYATIDLILGDGRGGRGYLQEKTSAAAAPRKPKNGAVSSPLKVAAMIGYFWIRSGTNWAIADAKIRKLIWDLAFFRVWARIFFRFCFFCPVSITSVERQRDNRSDRWWRWQIGAKVGRDYYFRFEI